MINFLIGVATGIVLTVLAIWLLRKLSKSIHEMDYI